MASNLEQKLWHQSSTLKKLDLNYLRTITKNFSEELGRGGFGIVYKGEKENGELVAVKKLTMSTTRIDDEKFINEVQHVMDICHPNIVRLEGYCYQTISEMIKFQDGHHTFIDEVYRLLCFEYIPNGGLDKYINDESSGMDWHTRYNIIEGICAGLYCLHEGRDGVPVLHLDLKPSNILLDKNITPKIVDFGLSRLTDEGKTHTCATSVIGTRGYMAPEYIDSGILSKEADIFSLGVIIVEVVTGKRKYPEGTTDKEFSEVYERWRTRLQKVSKKTSLEEGCQQVDQCIRVGRKCMDKDRKRRPDIREIFKILERNKHSVPEDGIYTSQASSSSAPDSVYGDEGTKAAREVTEQEDNTKGYSRGNSISMMWKNDNVNTNPEKMVKNMATGMFDEHILKPTLDGAHDPQNLTFALLMDITNGFSQERKISSGGYAEVYKVKDHALGEGMLNGGEIVVKKLFPFLGDDGGFYNQCNILKKVRHKNVIRLIGYCYEIAHKQYEYQGKLVWSQIIVRALCFEYMKRGSLANHISADSCIHDWPTTYKIINGVCEGLHHLHNGGEDTLFHLDLKPDNILLNEDLVPKIGGFDLARSFHDSHTHQISTCKGTIGFIPQEYINSQMVSPKNDVFSLGVIIFYMMAGKMVYHDYWYGHHLTHFSPKIQQKYIEHVQEFWKTKMQASKGYRWDETDLLQVTKCFEIALRCVENDREERPLIEEIVGELRELDFKIEEMLKDDPKPLICNLQNLKLS